MGRAAAPGEGIQQTRFAYLGEVQTARLFIANQTPTGNVIDLSRGPLSTILTREKSDGSSGSIEDDPWRLR